MGMILDDSVIREIEVANNATDSKEEDYHLQIARWLKDYKRLLEWESSYNSIRNELKQEPCKGNIYLTKEAYGELCYKASKWNELELCEDTISRADVLDLCDSKDPEYKVTHFKEDVECLPSVYPQPKTGHWISVNTGKQSHTKDGMTIESVKCSECGEWLTASDEYACNGNFCPNCGVEMVEAQESDE